ncbi:dTDP-4-dehydrorhamnose reductase family protein [Pseudomonas fluorescens]|uniref:dTDP-4-dehydrorhamnose reductase family protein n=1 Tax=Pseudomonas fluorescens TaxID=294 RepID=UPI0010E41BEA|nr:SDR family oxidoreductase [Pseudomonas fluorescens]TCV55898.1 dTDP-4-dehydrorhamnose reductase [Pseudomonas fluorescens]
MRILILGASGMLGNSTFNVFSEDHTHDVRGTIRSESSKRFFKEEHRSKLLAGVDVLDQDALVKVLEEVKPEVVINCVGLIKQLAHAQDPLSTLPVNAMFPHRLAQLCGLMNVRLVHISTDCVFSGRQGMYKETDLSDAEDLYGKSKFIGELHNRSNSITLRTSIIGHELNSHLALVEWFLAQNKPVKGYSKAVFSGLPTVELASIIKGYVLTNPALHGLYHVAASPISKLELLRLVSSRYGKSIEIIPDESFAIDRSLDGTRFHLATGYTAPAWPELIDRMYEGRASYIL